MTKAKNIVATALLLSTMSSCGLYTKFDHTPDSEIVDNLYNYIEATTDTTTIASYSWREVFTDPKLQSLIEQGLESNTDLNVAKLNVDQATLALRTARLAYLPSLGLEASGSTNSTPASSYTLAASASWEIDVFGKLTNAKEQQKAIVEQSKAYEQVIQTQLVATIANNYYSILLLDDQLSISRTSLKAWEENIRSMEALNKAGRVNNTSVLQSKASKVALESSIASIEEQIAVLENTLSALLATPAQKIERGTIEDMSFNELLGVGVPLQLVSNRPDVRVAEFELAQAYYATNIARASLYPNITLGGSASFSDGSGVISNPSEVIFSAVASIVQPIFYQKTLRTQVAISKLQQEQALLQFNQALLDAATEVNAALISWRSASKQLTLGKEQIELLTQAVRNSELLMKHGSVNYLEVLTAQQTLLQAELSYSSSKFSELQSVIELYRALGGGR